MVNLKEEIEKHIASKAEPETVILPIAKELTEKKYNTLEVHQLVRDWADDWYNPDLKPEVLLSMRRVSKNSEFNMSDLNKLIATELKDRKTVKEDRAKDNKQSESIDAGPLYNDFRKRATSGTVKDFLIDYLKSDKFKNPAATSDEREHFNKCKILLDLIQSKIIKDNSIIPKQVKPTKEELRQLAIEKEQERLEHAKFAGFAFSGLSMFTDFLATAKTFWEIQPFFYDRNRIWWLWNTEKKRWEKVDDVDLMNAIDNTIQTPTTNLSIKSEIIEAMKRVGRRKKPKDPERTWIQFMEDIYDLKTGKSFKATPEYFITNPIPWQIGNSCDTPVIDSILREWVVKEGIQDESYIKTLQEIMAYCFLSYMPIHRVFCFIGEGLNGKGSFLRLIEKLVGVENTCATELEVLSSERFESSKLFKKLVCFIGEVDKGIFKKTKTLKSLTGEDMIRIEFKRIDGFDAKNYANPLIATNHLPETSDKTKGFYRRWTIVDFPNIFNEKKDIIQDIPEEEFNNFCRKAIDILKDLLARGEFTNDGTLAQREDKYEKHSNYINEFVKLYCNQDPEGWVEFKDLHEKYNEFLISEGLTKKSKIELGRLLVLKGYVKKVKRVITNLGYGSNDTTKVCVFGLKFKEEDLGLTI